MSYYYTIEEEKRIYGKPVSEMTCDEIIRASKTPEWKRQNRKELVTNISVLLAIIFVLGIILIAIIKWAFLTVFLKQIC